MDRINEKFNLQQKAFVIWLIICAFMPLNGNEFSSRFLKHFDYREIGPTRQGGRVVSIAVSSQDP